VRIGGLHDRLQLVLISSPDDRPPYDRIRDVAGSPLKVAGGPAAGPRGPGRRRGVRPRSVVGVLPVKASRRPAVRLVEPSARRQQPQRVFRLRVGSTLVVVVDEVAARSVRTQSGRVKRPAEVGLVLGMAHDGPQFGLAVRKLTLVAVAARAVLLEWSTQLRLVAGWRRRRHQLGDVDDPRARVPDALRPALR